MTIEHDWGQSAESSSANRSKTEAEPTAQDNLLFFNIATSTLVHYHQGTSHELINFSDTHEHLYYFLKYLLTSPVHSDVEIALIYSDIIKNIPVVAARLRLQSATANGLVLVDEMKKFLESDELAHTVRDQIKLQINYLNMKLMHKLRYEVQVECSLPFYLPYAFQEVSKATTAYNHTMYQLHVGDKQVAKTVGQDVVALVAILHERSAQKPGEVVQLTAEELLMLMVSSLPRTPRDKPRTIQSVFNAYKQLVGVDPLVRQMVRTTWQPGKTDNTMFWLNPVFIPAAEFMIGK